MSATTDRVIREQEAAAPRPPSKETPVFTLTRINLANFASLPLGEYPDLMAAMDAADEDADVGGLFSEPRYLKLELLDTDDEWRASYPGGPLYLVRKA